MRGLVAQAIDRMIRRSVRRSFRGVYWVGPSAPISQPAIFVPNHHGWHDGYVMYLALAQLGLAGIHDWIAEYDAFPLFGKVGGMPFPPDDAARRVQTIRRTIRHMKEDGHSLLLFAEGTLHRPPALLPFGKSLDAMTRYVPNASVVPVGIRYEYGLHERPECYIRFGNPVEPGPDIGYRTRLCVAKLLDHIAVDRVVAAEDFQLLHRGTLDVNERWSMRDIPVIR